MPFSKGEKSEVNFLLDKVIVNLRRLMKELFSIVQKTLSWREVIWKVKVSMKQEIFSNITHTESNT